MLLSLTFIIIISVIAIWFRASYSFWMTLIFISCWQVFIHSYLPIAMIKETFRHSGLNLVIFILPWIGLMWLIPLYLISSKLKPSFKSYKTIQTLWPRAWQALALLITVLVLVDKPLKRKPALIPLTEFKQENLIDQWHCVKDDSFKGSISFPLPPHIEHTQKTIKGQTVDITTMHVHDESAGMSFIFRINNYRENFDLPSPQNQLIASSKYWINFLEYEEINDGEVFLWRSSHPSIVFSCEDHETGVLAQIISNKRQLYQLVVLYDIDVKNNVRASFEKYQNSLSIE